MQTDRKFEKKAVSIDKFYREILIVEFSKGGVRIQMCTNLQEEQFFWDVCGTYQKCVRN